MSTRHHRVLTPYLFLMPSAAVLGMFLLGGAIQVIFYSFTRYTAFSGPEFVGLDNYARTLSSERFWRCLVNSIAYLTVTPVLICISLIAALAVDARLRGMGWLRLALFLPVITPTLVASIAWRQLLNDDDGLINATLKNLGMRPIGWLTEYPWTLVSAMLVTLWKGFGFYMMVFLAALTAVPTELKEAAAVDGAGRWSTFRVVVLPALRPAIALVAVVSSISALKVFEELYVTVRGAPITQQTVVPLIYRIAFEEGNYGLASAVGMVLFLVILGFSLINLKLSRRPAPGGAS